MKQLVMATKNKGKIAEIKSMLEGMDIEVLSLADFPAVEEAVEDGATFRENAAIKAHHYYRHTGVPCLADDSGLEVDALGGRPGVYSARYSGDGATDLANNAKVLTEMESAPDEERTARFRCSMVLYDGEQELISDGTCEGLLLREGRGENGFGYDPIFFLPQYGRTLAEVGQAEKNAVSHRGKALRKMIEKITNIGR